MKFVPAEPRPFHTAARTASRAIAAETRTIPLRPLWTMTRPTPHSKVSCHRCLEVAVVMQWRSIQTTSPRGSSHELHSELTMPSTIFSHPRAHPTLIPRCQCMTLCFRTCLNITESYFCWLAWSSLRDGTKYQSSILNAWKSTIKL